MANQEKYNENLTLDEIVFEHRNKEYGAYDLRTIYPRMLTKSFIVGTSIFLLVALSPLIYTTIKNLTKPEKVEVKSDLVNILDDEKVAEQPKEEEPPPPPPKPEEPPKQEVIQNVVPEPVKAPKVETPPPPISEQLKTTTGLQNQEGEKVTAYVPPPPPPAPPGKGTAVEVKPQVSETQVYNEVEQLAEFPGGLNAFRSKVGSSFDTGVMEGDEGTVKSEVTFIVERDGSITDVNASGSNKTFNAEAIRTVKSIKTKWTPAKINGQAVRYRYRLPITMQFE